MYTPLQASVLFGASKVATTKGPHWRISQFAGFLLEAVSCYSLRLVLHNLSSSWNSVVVQHRVDNEQPGTETSFQIAPGEFKVVTIPTARAGKVLFVKCNYQVSLIEIQAGTISSAWDKVASSGLLLTPNANWQINQQSASIAGQAAEGATSTLQFKPDYPLDWSCLLELSCNGTLEVQSSSQRTLFTGYCYWLFDQTTPQLLHLTAKTNTNYSLAYQQYADLRTAWQPASGLTIWNVQ